ncbi:MAG: hypothetical protein KatS3mg002_0792 [Candidatus Woesearchaeota archaeon]|nr:MAG: hypothetical protein KatS3mg002_0792 [Candidatus Woesearchaeota archaeon]
MINEESIDVKVHKRIPLIYDIVENIVMTLYKKTSTIYTDIPDSTLKIINSEAPKLYVGLHKSLWETMGIPVVLKSNNAKVPYVVIGKNLVKGVSKFFMQSIGGIYVERASKEKSRQSYASALEIKKKIILALDIGYDVLIFPTDGRTKNGQTNFFYSTPFDAALSLSRKNPVYIIPVNVDYEKLPDMPRMLKSIEKEKSYTFRIWHFSDWLKNLGTEYVSFGEPILVDCGFNRKELNRIVLERAKGLVKILPVNIYAEAAIRFKKNNGIFEKHVEKVLKELDPHKEKFRGFRDLEDIINNSGITLNDSERKYVIYSGYISHYLYNS